MDFDSYDHELMAVLLYLQWVLDNLEYLQNVENPSVTIYSDELNEIGTDLSFIPDTGLCDNILGQYLYRCEIEGMFESWSGFSGNLTYPCDDREDFTCDDPVNLYLNPKRISLIHHIIECINTELEKRDAQED